MPTASVFASLRPRLAGFFGDGRPTALASGPALAAIATLFLALALVAAQGGDFPLNDDWAYGESTRVFLNTGKFYMPAACAAGFTHILWGSAFAKVFGFSYAVLRYATLVAGVIGAYLAYFALIELGIGRRESLFCALLYAGNPIMINLYLGFMSDVPALTLCAGFLFFLIAALRRRSFKHYLIALVLLILAITIRQSSVVLALAAPALLFSRLGTLRRRILLACLLLLTGLCTFGAVDAWLLHRDATGQSVVLDYANARAGHRAYLLGFAQMPLQQSLKTIGGIGVVACYIGLFTAPLAISALAFALTRWPKHRFPFSSGARGPAIAAGIVIGLFVCAISAYYQCALQHALMPFCENILRITSVGAQAIMGIANSLLTPRQKLRLTVLSYLLAWLVLAQLIALALLAGARIRNTLSKLAGRQAQGFAAPFAVLCASLATIAFLTVETVVRCTDRYYLLALLPGILALAYFGRLYKIRFASQFGIILLLAFLAYGLFAGQDYLGSNTARWRALARLEREGVVAASIDGGAEYNVLRDINVYASHYRGEPPRNTWRWWPIRGEEYIVSFSPVPDYQEKGRETYFSLLTMSEHPIFMLQKIKIKQ